MSKLLVKRFVLKWIFPGVLPLILLITGIRLYSNNGYFYLRNADPEYHYLMSSLALGGGSIRLNTDHPGTPIQVIFCFVNRLVHIFRNENSFAVDVIMHPELYLFADLIALLLITTLLLYLSGLIMTVSTGNALTGAFLQSGPFLGTTMLMYTGRILPETLFLGLVPLFFAAMVSYSDAVISHRPDIPRWLIFMLAAACISVKFSFLPFALMPLILLHERKHRLRGAIQFFAYFLLFTFPLFVSMKSFLNWIGRIFIHSGKHGSGPANIADPEQLFMHAATICKSAPWLVVALCFSFIMLAAYGFQRSSSRKINPLQFRFLWVFSAAFLLQLLMIAKHFAMHYLVAANLSCIFLVYCSVRLAGQIFFLNRIILPASFLLIHLICFIGDDSLRHFSEIYDIQKQRALKKTELCNLLKSRNLSNTLIIGSDDWNLLPAYALWFGKIMTPDNAKFNTVFNRLYPDVYFHKEGTESFYNWNNQLFTAGELAGRIQSATVLSHRHQPAQTAELYTALSSLQGAHFDLILKDDELNIKAWKVEITPPAVK